MKVLGLCLLLAGALCGAQTITATANKTSFRPGEQATVTYTLAGQAPTVIAALQVTAGATGVSESGRTVGAQASAAAKVLTCNVSGTCVLAGPGAIAIANGVVATSTITAGAVAGPATLKLTGILAVNGAANLVPLASGPDLVITILAKEDLNGDGKIDMQDITIIVLQVLSGTCTSGMDQNGDGVCSIQDVQLVALKAQ